MSKKTLLLNWKMQLSVDDATKLATKIKNECTNWDLNEIEIGICPDFLSLHPISKIIKNSGISLGAQNASSHEKGAFTGEISPRFLKEIETEFIIIGHSERRKMLETEELINKKMVTVIENNLTPVLCIGESFEERQNNQKDLVIINQLKSALENIDLKKIKRLIVAYEPIWVIGSGQAIEPEEADETSMIIKRTLVDLFYSNNINLEDEEFSKKIQLLYGGSVDKTNINNFLEKENINGVLVGGAGIEFESLNNLIKAIKK